METIYEHNPTEQELRFLLGLLHEEDADEPTPNREEYLKEYEGFKSHVFWLHISNSSYAANTRTTYFKYFSCSIISNN